MPVQHSLLDIRVRRRLKAMLCAWRLKVVLERDEDYNIDQLLFINVSLQSRYLIGENHAT